MKTITDYMMELHKDFQKKRDVTDSTASQYIRNLYTLNSSRSFTNLAWLKNIESVNLRLAEYAETTQKNLLSTIVSALSMLNDKPSYKKIYTFWYNRMMEKIHDQKQLDTSQKTKKQEDNWLNWDIIIEHENRLEKEVNTVLKNKHLSPNDWNTILSYMVLSLFTKFAPRRNQDYQFMKVVKTEKEANDDEFNYYVITNHKFIFNKYKTSKTHGSQIFEVPDELVKVINLYLSKHPNPKGMFLVNHDGSPLNSNNSLTRILNRIFGKNVGATMLRHIYLSSKYDVQEMNEDADKMAHTSGLQHDYMKVNLPTFLTG
jgi:integrase